jgi:hypothetical protein
MAQKIIDIGVQGNDGTGDSIRESFNKVNQNFAELYAVFGVGGTIRFTDLADAPSSYRASQIIMSSKTGVGLVARDIEAGAGILISKNDDSKLTIAASIAGLVNDNLPTLSQNMDAAGKIIGNLGDPTEFNLAQFNSRYGADPTTLRKIAVNKGYVDDNYVGGTAIYNNNQSVSSYNMSLPLKIRPEPALPQTSDVDYDPTLTGNFVASEAVPRKAAVYRGGDTMTGPLTLGDHPAPFNGYGTPLNSDDLQAATKLYVDANTYYSGVNLYVSTTKGDDLQTNTPTGREGRAWHYAYKTIGAAAQQAESLINLSQIEPGPYKQQITWSTSVSQFPSVIQSYQPAGGNSAVSGYTNAIWLLQTNKSFIQSETIAYLNKKYVNTFNLNKSRYSVLLNNLMSGVGYDLLLNTNFNTVNAVQQIYNSYNSDLISDELTQLIDAINYTKTTIVNYGYVSSSVNSYLDILVDALGYDVVFQSNYRSIEAALAFTEQGTTISPTELADLLDYSSIPTTTISGDGSTVTLGFAQQITTPFVLNEPIIVSGINPSVYNGIFTITNVTSTSVSYSSSATASVIGQGVISKSNLVNNLLLLTSVSSNPSVVSNIKSNASTISLMVQGGAQPTPIYSSLSSTIPGQTSAITLLIDNIPFIQAEVAGWIKTHYPNLVYNTTTSATNIKYIVYSLIYDLMYGGNSQSIYTALTRYWNSNTNTSYFTATEKTAFSQAIAYMNTVVQAVVTNTTPATLYQLSVVQYINSTLGGNATSTATFVSGSTSSYNLTVTGNIVPISKGQVITGTGFTSGQTVVSTIVSGVNTIVQLSAYPTVTPSGSFTFTSPVLGSLSANIATVSSIVGNATLPSPTVTQPTTANAVSSLQAARNAIINPTEIVALKNIVSTYLQNSKFAIISNSSVISSINTLFNTATDILTIGYDKMYAVGLVTGGSSASTTMTVTLISGTISPGQRVYGTGFGSQTVTETSIAGNSVTITLSNTPSVNPSSYVKFIFAPTIDTSNLSSSNAAAVNALLANLDFVANEATAYVTQLPLFAGVTFSSTNLIRDIIYITEAVCYDLANGSNIASVNTANNQFWYAGSSLVPGLNETNQLYNAAFVYAQTIAIAVSKNQAPSNTYSAVPQSTNPAWAVGAGAATTINNLFGTVIDVLANNTAGTYLIVAPDTTTSASGPDYVAARTIIESNKSTISNLTNTYLATTYTGNFKYNQNTCSRDIGYIIDGIVLDLYSAGTYQSVNAGKAYYRNASAKSVAIGTQYSETVDGLVFAKNLAIQVLNQQSAQRFQSVYSQITSGSYISSAPAVTSFTNNFNIILNIIQYGYGAAPTPSFGTGTYTLTMSNGGNGYVDQGSTGNVHIIPGKILVGAISNAYGQIVTYTQGGNGISVDTIVLRMTRPGFFISFSATAVSGSQGAYTIVVSSATNIVVGLGVTGVGIGLGAVVTQINGTTLTLSQPNSSTVSGTLTFGEPLFYGETVSTLPITIFVESGIYYEDYPIRLANNVSLKGDDFRRVLIRPLDRISQSPWASIFFYRDGIIDAIQLNPINYTTDYATAVTLTLSATGGTFNATLATGLAPQSWVGLVLTDNTSDSTVVGKAVVNSVTGNVMNVTALTPFTSTTFTSGNWHIYGTLNYGRHYLTNPLDVTSTPLNNKNIDAFLMNDATHISMVSFQGHGGFALVLDPEGQIKSKSAFIRDCASFAASTNKKQFAGGMFVDGFAGRLTGKITAIQTVGLNNQTQITVVGSLNSGLDVRPPQIPCSFYVQGSRYQIDDIVSFDSTTYTANLMLDVGTPFSTTSAYNSTTMNTNIGTVIDALAYDLALGTNYKTSRMGIFYLLPQNAVTGLSQTVLTQAVDYVNTQAQTIGLDVTGTNLVKTNSTNINNIINNGYGSVPTLILTAASTSTTDAVRALNILEDATNKSFIQQEISAWIAANYSLASINSYSSITAQRDFGNFVDAIVYDLLYGGNSATYDLVTSYWYNSSTQSILTQAGNFTYGTITIYTQALSRLATILPQMLLNSTVTKSSGNNITQNTTLTAISTSSLVSVSITGTGGQFSCNATTLVVGQYITVSGALSGTGSITGYSNPTSYYIIATNGSTSFTLSTTYGGSAITTTAGTTTGLTFSTSTVLGTLASLMSPIIDYIYDGTFNTATARVDPDTAVAGQASNLITDFTLLKTTNKASILTGLQSYLSSGAGISINIEMAGNRSALGDNFTQVNDLGYGIVATNGGLSEQVSTFSYYCYSSMWSINGGAVRSVGSSSAHGIYGLRATGFNPTELPDNVTLVNDTEQTARIYKQGITASYMTPYPTTNAFNIYIIGYNNIPTNNSQVEIDHTLAGGTITRYSISNVQRTTISVNGQSVLNLTLSTSGLGGTVSSGLAFSCYDGQLVSIKVLGDVLFSGILPASISSTTASLQYVPALANIYAVSNYLLTYATGETLPSNYAILESTTVFNYYQLTTDNTKISVADPLDGTKTQGSKVGDNKVAVIPAGNDLIISQINTGTLITAWAGRIHRIASYTKEQYSGTGTVFTVTPTLLQTSATGNYLTLSSTTGLVVNSPIAFSLVTQTPTLQSTNNSGNLLTLSSATGLVVGETITFTAVVQTGVITQTFASTDPTRPNQLVITSTTGMVVGEPIVLAGSAFGGLANATYYITNIPDSTHITISSTYNGSNVSLTAGSGFMAYTAGSSLGGITQNTTYYIKTIAGNNITVSLTYGGSTVTVSQEAGSWSAVAGGQFGGLSAGATYYITQITGSQINVSTSVNGSTLSVTNGNGTWGSIAGATPTGLTVVLSNTTGVISNGQAIVGTGFSSGQTISGTPVVSGSNLLITLSASPNLQPSGTLTFGVSTNAYITLDPNPILNNGASGFGVPSFTYAASVYGSTLTSTGTNVLLTTFNVPFAYMSSGSAVINMPVIDSWLNFAGSTNSNFNGYKQVYQTINQSSINVSSTSNLIVGMTLSTGYLGTVTATSNTTASFTATLSGTTLTVTAGSTPTIGMIVSGTGIPSNTYIVSGSGPFTLSQTVSSGTGIAVTGTGNYITVSSNTGMSVAQQINVTLTYNNGASTGAAFGGLTTGTYYILTISGTSVSIGTSATSYPITLTTATGTLGFQIGYTNSNAVLPGTVIVQSVIDSNNFTVSPAVWLPVGTPILASTPSTVASVIISSGGSGYNQASPPKITFTGGGSQTSVVQAIANATVNQYGVVTKITVTSPGQGYTSVPTLTIDPPSSGTQAQASVVMSSSSVFSGSVVQTTPTTQVTLAYPTVPGLASTVSNTINGTASTTAGAITAGSNITLTSALINGTTLTFSGASGGTVTTGMVLSGGTVLAGTYITSGSGTTWTVNYGQSSSCTTATLYTFTVSSAPTGSFASGMVLSGGSITGSPYITAQLTATNSAAATTTATASSGSTSITVASATSIALTQFVVATGIPSNTYVVGINGTTITLSQSTTSSLSSTSISFYAYGQAGTYSVSRAVTQTSTTVTGTANLLVKGSISGEVVGSTIIFSGTGFGNVTSTQQATGTFSSGGTLTNILVVTSVTGTIAVGQIVGGTGFNGLQLVTAVSLVGTTATVVMSSAPSGVPTGSITFSSFWYYINSATQGALGNTIAISSTLGGSNLVVTTASGSLSSYSPEFVSNQLISVSGTPSKSGSSTPYSVTFTLSSAMSITNGAYYQVTGNTNPLYNGLYATSSSTTASSTTLILTYPYDPGTWSTSTTTYIAASSLNSATTTQLGINRPFDSFQQDSLEIGFASGTAAQVVTKISTTRATGHDFLNIGTGGYNTTNYPSVIYGNPVLSPDYTKQVLEEGVGRVFFVSTDQDGIFRVGKFFNINQNTGNVALGQSISLNNLNGLGFKNGITVTSFTNDATFSNPSSTAIPTQAAISNFIDYRLGLTAGGSQVSATSLLGPGFLPLNGAQAMTGNLNMNGSNIINLTMPAIANPTDVTNKNYVDVKVASKDSLSKLSDVVLSSLANGNHLIYDSASSAWKNIGIPTGDVNVTYTAGSPGTLTTAIQSGKIYNSMVNSVANVAQSKLVMNWATTVSSANTTTITVSSNTTLTGVAITGTSGQFSCSASTLYVGQSVTITGTNSGSGSISGYTTGTTYYIIATNGTTTFTLSSTYNGSAVTTTTGTPVSWTYTVAPLVIGKQYTIASLGTTTTQANWNTIAGTSGVTYVVGSTFQSAVTIGTGNGTVYDNTTVQAALGLASFDNTIFTASNGYISLKTATGASDGISLSKLSWMSSGYLLGNRSGSTAAPTLITPAQVVSDAGGLFVSNFGTNTGALTQSVPSTTFVGNLSGTNLTYVSGTVPTVGSTISGTGIVSGTTISSGTSPNFVISQAATTGTNITITSIASGATATYTIVPVSVGNAASSLVRSDTDKSVDVGSLKVAGIPTLSSNGTTLYFANANANASVYFMASSQSGGAANTISTQTYGTFDTTNGTFKANTFYAGTLATDICNFTGKFTPGSTSTIDLASNGAILYTKTLNTGSSSTAGTITGQWTLVGSSTLQATYADLAEYYEGDKDYEVGTVLVFGGEKEVTLTDQVSDTRVAGVVSNTAAYTMNAECPGHKILIALQGRVPVKVVGRVRKGDMLTTAATPGHAVKALDPKLGSIIGKALEDKDYGEAGVIQVAVGRM